MKLIRIILAAFLLLTACGKMKRHDQATNPQYTPGFSDTIPVKVTRNVPNMRDSLLQPSHKNISARTDSVHED